jgi:hypothetical protein
LPTRRETINPIDNFSLFSRRQGLSLFGGGQKIKATTTMGSTMNERPERGGDGAKEVGGSS